MCLLVQLERHHVLFLFWVYLPNFFNTAYGNDCPLSNIVSVHLSNISCLCPQGCAHNSLFSPIERKERCVCICAHTICYYFCNFVMYVNLRKHNITFFIYFPQDSFDYLEFSSFCDFYISVFPIALWRMSLTYY